VALKDLSSIPPVSVIWQALKTGSAGAAGSAVSAGAAGSAGAAVSAGAGVAAGAQAERIIEKTISSARIDIVILFFIMDFLLQSLFLTLREVDNQKG
jgi:hypothetical protein